VLRLDPGQPSWAKVGEPLRACLPVGRGSRKGGHACAPKRYSAQARRAAPTKFSFCGIPKNGKFFAHWTKIGNFYK
jgi:hypothetical protein